MEVRSHPHRVVLCISIAVLSVLACGVVSSAAPPTSAPAFDPTKLALEFQATLMAQQLTQVAAVPQGPAAPATVEAQPTPAITPTADVETLIQSANVLVYENTDARGIGMWIQDALNGLGVQYTQTGSYSGHFMENLNSGTKYDLIIVGAEDKDKISGEFWDVINARLVRDKAALIAEIWYLDREAYGPISQILSGCGIRYQKDYPVAESIYWWVPDHPVFNEPNTVVPLIHYNRYWSNQTGDRIRVGSGGQATLLAGLSAQPASDGAVLATCYEGRVIIQTFSDHDYDKNEIVPLWQNYIYYTLKNHFEALQ